jgi:hypothetical protein
MVFSLRFDDLLRRGSWELETLTVRRGKTENVSLPPELQEIEPKLKI